MQTTLAFFSWITDWSHNPGTKVIGATRLSSKFKASLSKKAKIVLNGNLLGISGVEIDTRMWRVCLLR